MSDMKKELGNPAHSGTVLRQVLGDGPKDAAASWFGVTKEELEKMLKGECAMSKEIAQKVHELLGTNRTPWMDAMIEGQADEVVNLVDAGGVNNLREEQKEAAQKACDSMDKDESCGCCCSKK